MMSVMIANKHFLKTCKHRFVNSKMLSIKMMDTTPLTSKFVEAGHVYYVATPIGNLKDISERAKEVLSSVDIICCEDTRNTVDLLRNLSLPHKQLISHHEHNWKTSTPNIISLIKKGNSIALVSDAGTPGISDPGAELAHALSAENIPIHPIPGPSAVISALSISGFQCNDFTFMGFLPVKGKERQQKLQRMYNTEHTVIFYEAPHRIKDIFRDLIKITSNSTEVSLYSTLYNMKDRPVVCCRELTKMHEEIKRGSVEEVLRWLETYKDKDEIKNKGRDNDKVIRGEFCVVLGPVGNDDLTTSVTTHHNNGINDMINDTTQHQEQQEYDVDSNCDDISNTTTRTTHTTQNDITNTTILPITRRPLILTLEERVSSHLSQLRSDGLDRKDAVQLVVEMLCVPRSVVYNFGINMKWESKRGGEGSGDGGKLKKK